MRAFLVVAFMGLLSATASAQETNQAMPDEQIKALGQDLSKVQAIVKAMNLEQQAKNNAADNKVVVIDPARVFSQADDGKPAIANVDEGSVLQVVGKAGLYLEVKPYDDVFAEWTKGYVKVDKVEIQRQPLHQHQRIYRQRRHTAIGGHPVRFQISASPRRCRGSAPARNDRGRE
jgi:hypothetical protein